MSVICRGTPGRIRERPCRVGWGCLVAAVAVGFVHPNAGAQTWARLFDDGRGGLTGLAVTVGGAAFVGGWLDQGLGAWGLVMKVDASGRVEWGRLLAGSSSGTGALVALDRTQDGGLVVAGGFGPYKSLIVKLDELGNLEWQKGPVNDPLGLRFGARAVAGTQDGGVVVAGSRLDASDDEDCWVWKLDGQGNTEWTWVLDAGRDEGCGSVIETVGGGYVGAAPALDSSTSEWFLWVFRLDPAGLLVWDRLFAGARLGFPAVVRESVGGDLVASSWRVMIRLDSGGNLLWQKDWMTPNPWGLVPARDDGVLGTGAIWTGSLDVWVFEVDPWGEPVWQKSYGLPTATEEGAAVVAASPTGDILVAGGSTLVDVNGDPWLLRLGPAGELGPPCPLVGATSVVPVDASLTLIPVIVTVSSPDMDVVDGDVVISDYTPTVLTQCCSFTEPGVPAEISSLGTSQPLVFQDRETLTWEQGSGPGACFWNLYRGELSGLRSASYGTCLRPGIPVMENFATDSTPPPPGGGWLYLVTGGNAFGEGPLGRDSAGNPRLIVPPCP